LFVDADGFRGSMSSISSVGSFNSTRSGADSQPLFFHVGSTDDELAQLNRLAVILLSLLLLTCPGSTLTVNIE